MKIDLDWIQEELDAGRKVELECIDKDEFINRKYGLYSEDNTGILESELIVLEVHDGFIRIKDTSSNIVRSEFKYFCIKQAPTFDDLIDVAVQAYKDGVLSKVELRDDEINLTKLGVISSDRGSSVFQDAISDINSLYTETFVIEREDDIKGVLINKETKIELVNGVACTVNDRTHCSQRGALLYVHNSHTNKKDQLAFTALKGATVTQQKGNK